MTDLIKSILELTDVQALQPDFVQIKRIPRETAENSQVLIFQKTPEKIVHILTTNTYPDAVKSITSQLDTHWEKYQIFYTSLEWFQEALKWYDQITQQELAQEMKQTQQQQAEWQSAIDVLKNLYDKRASLDPGEFILQIVRYAFQSGASDLHFQPKWDKIELRLRLDGILHDILTFDLKDFLKYLQKLKFISGVKMNIDYLPQDGRFSFEAVNPNKIQTKVDARVNFMPGLGMESTVIRFLDSTRQVSTFQDIWFSDENYEKLKPYLAKTTGLIVVAWPTWSGKTTTLYTMLNTLNTWETKIITLEDPIEYVMNWIQQSQIDYSKWYDYETWLHAVLRHDPDVILVGETRSLETADISINASLTGHLVFTTLHTNNAVAAINRLLSMEVKPYLLAPALQLVIGQRLVRKICPHCWVKVQASYAADADIQQVLKTLSDLQYFKDKPTPSYDGQIIQATGCEQCNKTWYIGRIAILELLEITQEIRKLIENWGADFEILGKARENGFITMKEEWVLKVLNWMTTIEEVQRVV